MLRAWSWTARLVDRLATVLAITTLRPAATSSTPGRWCPGVGRAPHLSGDPPTVTIRTGHGDRTVCRRCWHTWSAADRQAGR